MGESTSTGGRARLFWQVSALVLIAAGVSERKAEAATATDGGITLDVQGLYAFDSSGIAQGPASKDSTFVNGGVPGTSGGYNLSGEITYQPAGTPWNFGVAVKYGRTRAGNRAHNFEHTATIFYNGNQYHYNTDQQLKNQAVTEHYSVDFEVGHDFGVGLFGPGNTNAGFGVRYAHFNSTVTGSFATQSRYFISSSSGSHFGTRNKLRAGRFTTRRATDAVGPRLFVKTVSPIPGLNGFSIGAGAGVAMLYGKQNIHTTIDMTSGAYAAIANRSKSRGIPNADGFVQLNWTAPNSGFTVGVGYKIDAYFTVMDGGFRSTSQVDSVEHGPYLDVSVKVP